MKEMPYNSHWSMRGPIIVTSILIIIIFLIGMFLGAKVFANEPIAIGYTPGEIIPVRVVCMSQDAMRAFIEGDPTKLSQEEKKAILAECRFLPQVVGIYLFDCVEGPVIDPAINKEFSVCRFKANSRMYYIQLPYVHPSLKDV